MGKEVLSEFACYLVCIPDLKPRDVPIKTRKEKQLVKIVDLPVLEQLPVL